MLFTVLYRPIGQRITLCANIVAKDVIGALRLFRLNYNGVLVGITCDCRKGGATG